MNSFKEQCIKLRRKDKTIGEIMAITGRSKSSIHFHIRDIPLSAKKKQDISDRSRKQAIALAGSRKGVAQRPIKEFQNWSPELVLLISHLIFDGEILNKNCNYNNRSKDLINRVEKLMCTVYDYPPKKLIDEVSGVYKIRYYNVALSNFLYNKAIELLRDIPSLSLEEQREFLRAFFDDEGCMDFRPKQNLRSIRGYQKNKHILFLVQKLLNNLHIESKIREPNEVIIVKKKNLVEFQKQINFSKGVSINPNRTNSIWKKPIEKRELLDQAIKSFKI